MRFVIEHGASCPCKPVFWGFGDWTPDRGRAVLFVSKPAADEVRASLHSAPGSPHRIVAVKLELVGC